MTKPIASVRLPFYYGSPAFYILKAIINDVLESVIYHTVGVPQRLMTWCLMTLSVDADGMTIIGPQFYVDSYDREALDEGIAGFGVMIGVYMERVMERLKRGVNDDIIIPSTNVEVEVNRHDLLLLKQVLVEHKLPYCSFTDEEQSNFVGGPPNPFVLSVLNSLFDKLDARQVCYLFKHNQLSC